MKKILLIATAIFLTSFFCPANVADDVRVRYINDELTMNKKFVNNLKNYLDNAFENQLKRFEDEELGFTSNIGNMFSAVFSSDKLQEKYTIRSKKYFDNMEIEQQTYNMGNKYLKNVTLLRNSYLAVIFRMRDVFRKFASSQITNSTHHTVIISPYPL
jgi:hypothetical protein